MAYKAACCMVAEQICLCGTVTTYLLTCSRILLRMLLTGSSMQAFNTHSDLSIGSMRSNRPPEL
eukprot:1161003-Pelagomonas_calceolata.AAC.7